MKSERELCVIGGGALGLTISIKLSHLLPVCLVVKPGQESSRSRENLAITGHEQASAGRLRVATGASAAASSYWLCVKAADIVGAIGALPATSREPVVLAGNGLGVFEEVRKLLPPARPLIRLVCNFGAALQPDGSVRLAGALAAVCASLEDHAAARDQIAELMSRFPAAVETSSNPLAAEWGKALVNVPVNSLCTLADAPNGAILDRPELREQAIELMKEVRLAASASGIELGEDYGQVLEGIRAHASNINSTLSDIRAGRPTETEFILGRVVEKARSVGIRLVRCEDVLERMRSLEREHVRR